MPEVSTPHRASPPVSLPRLYALRAMYLILLVIIPQMTAASMVYSTRSLSAADGWGFTACLLAALSLLAALERNPCGLNREGFSSAV